MAEKRKRTYQAWLLWTGGAILLLGGFGIVRSQTTGGKGGAIPAGVVVARVEVGVQQQKIAATGIVASQIGTQVRIGSQVTGRIRELPADVGTRVRAGQIIAVLDSPDLQAQVEVQRQAVSSADAALAQARSRLAQAIETTGYSRDQTDAQIAEADAELRAAEAKIDSSAASARLQPTQTAADIRKAQASLSTARSQLKQVELTDRQQIQQSQSSVDDAQVSVDNGKRTLDRQQRLLAKGFVAVQDVDNTETSYQQAIAKLASAKAGLDITREKVRADQQSADDAVKQAQASLEAAQAGTLQDAARQADLHVAQEGLRQSVATLKLRTADRRADRIKIMAAREASDAVVEAEAGVRQARAQLSYQQAQLDKTVIRSPIDGTVLSITAQQGETVAAGLAAPTLITVADLNRLEVRAYVDETDIGRVRLGLPVETRVEAFPGRIFRGKVTKIASASTIKDNVVTYETTIAVTNTGGLLRPDMTADVTLILGEHPKALLVPSEAVHSEVDRSIVYVLHPDRSGKDRVEDRTVEVGFDDGARREIRSGLKEGDSVVIAGLARLGVKATDAPRDRP